MENQNEMEIDLLALFHYLKKRIAIILAVLVLSTVVGFVVTQLFITPKYTASTRVYVLNRSNESTVVSSDFSLSNYMISDYKVLITGQNVTKEVIAKLNLNMSHGELAGKISVTAPDNTRVLQISVTDISAQRAADIANTVRDVAVAQIKSIMDVDAVNVVYAADVPPAPSSPNVMRNTAVAALLGLVAVVGVLTVIFIMDDTIRTEEDVERYLGLSTLGVIPISGELAAANKKSAKTKKIVRK